MGTKINATDLASKSPRPTHGSARRKFGKNAVVPRGPIGLLLESIHEIGASLSVALDIALIFGSTAKLIFPFLGLLGNTLDPLSRTPLFVLGFVL